MSSEGGGRFKPRDNFLFTVLRLSRGALAGFVTASYGFFVLLFAGVYQALRLTTARSFPGNVFFSLVTQATVGYGDVVANPGFGRLMTSVQIVVGVGWTMLLPAVLVLRLLTPDPRAIVLGDALVFDPSERRLVVRVLNASRFTGIDLNVRLWLRQLKDDQSGFISFPIRIRRDLESDVRFTHLQPRMPFFFRSDPLPLGRPPQTLGNEVQLVHFDPAMIRPADALRLEVLMSTPFGPITRHRDYRWLDLSCGSMQPVYVEVGGKPNWSAFDTAVPVETSPDGIQQCHNCDLRARCRLQNRVA